MASTQREGSDSTVPSQKGTCQEAPQYEPCDLCPFGASTNKRRYTDYEALKESAERGHCQACAGILNFLNAQQLQLQPFSLFYHSSFFELTATLRFASGKESLSYEFFVKHEEPMGEESTNHGVYLNRTEIPRLRAPSGDTSSEAAFDTLKHWISRCKEEHPQCQPAGDKTLPYRVLEIESTEPLRIRLVENCTQYADYACLSHRWGSQTKSKSLNKGNLNLYKAEVPADKFDALVRDAIVATSRLGLRFIWIDCYCIVQDNPEDWKTEAGKMAFIYENAFFTISATSSEDGCSMFSTIARECEAFEVTKVGGEPVYIRQQLSHPCIVLDDYEERLCGLSLTRAWVFQERLLSNRFIHFIRGEIFWECRESTWCECNSEQGFWESQRGNRARTIRSQDWDLIAEQYNSTQLTFEKDRLPALAGVARRYAEACEDWTYLAGLWKENLPSSLAWYKEGWDEPRPLEKVAPTWSWASLPRGKELKTTRIAGPMSLVGYKIYPIGADVYTGAKWAEITVEGSTLDLTVYRVSDGHLIGRHENVFLGIGSDFKPDPDDETKDRAVPNGASCLLLLLCDDNVRLDWYQVFGILLLPQTSGADGEDAKFERIGCITENEFEYSHVDVTGEYAGYRGGFFPHWARKHKDPLKNPTTQWLLDRVKRRQVTLV